MTEALLANEALLRSGVFVALLLAMALWELLKPRRVQTIPRRIRWPNNLALVVSYTLLVRAAFPVVTVGAAVLAQSRGWGVFNAVALPLWTCTLASVLVLDLVVYLQHVVFHYVPVLWRVHRVHHTDPEFDVTTGVRFHPVELLISTGIKYGAIIALGAPPIAVVISEILLSGTSVFNHANVRIPKAVDRVVRFFVVTPDMHRVHHSIVREETNSNFGFNFPWWDRIFGTYRDQPAAGHRGMTIGLEQFRSRRDLWLDRLLVQPLLDDPGARSPDA